MSPYLAMAVMSGVLWGSAGVFVRILGDWGMDDVTVVFSRVSVALFMLALLISVTDRRLFCLKRGDVWMFVVSAFSMVALNLFYTMSVGRASLSFAAVLLSMSPIFVLIMAHVMFGEAVTCRKVCCMILAISGCVLVSGILEESGSVSAAGTVSGIAAAFFYALYGIMSKRASASGYSTYTILFYSILISALALLPFSNVSAMIDYGAEGIGNIGILILQASFSSIVPYIFYTLAVTKGDAGVGSLLAACGEPMAAAIFGLFFFTEVPSPMMIVGMIIAVVSIAIMCAPEKKGADRHDTY